MRTMEELESDLRAEAAIQQDILEDVTELLTAAGFQRIDEKNNYNFEDSTEDMKALFSIDNTTFKYVGYVTQEGSNSSTYSVKGEQEGIQMAARKFLAAYEDIVLEQQSTNTDDEM